jgi:hypothetical protein
MLFACVLLTPSVVMAQSVFFDTFENGPSMGQTATKGDDAFDAKDLQWYSSLASGTLNVQADTFAGGSSARAMNFATSDPFRRYGANFTSTTLAVGTTTKLSFNVRLTETASNNAVGFRFGLFNSNGTNISSDNPNMLNQPSQQNDDFGYHIRFATGTNGTNLNEICDEPAGDNPLGGGTGGTLISTVSGTASSINNTTNHLFELLLIRSTGTTLNFQLFYDGVLKATGTDTSSIVTTFDAIYIGNGNVSTDFSIDNVQLQVPEPASLSLITLAGFGLLRRRQRTCA